MERRGSPEELRCGGDCPVLLNIETIEAKCDRYNREQRDVYEIFKYALLQIRGIGRCEGIKTFSETGVVQCDNTTAEALANLATGGVVQFKAPELREITRPPAKLPRW